MSQAATVEYDELDILLGADPTRTPQVTADAIPSPKASAVAFGGGSSYEGASRQNQLAMWGPSTKSADNEIEPEKGVLDARSRDMVRNDAYVAGGAVLHKDNIVGAVFLLNAKPMTKVLWGSEDETWENEFQEEVETKFTLWAESDRCWSDAQGTKTLTDQVRLAVGTHLATGEVLATSEWMPDDGRPFRTAMQMVDTDRLSTPFSRSRDQSMRMGVERDLRGCPIAYHIRMGHPDDFLRNANSYLWRRVMARKPWGRPNVLHIYDQNRPDQSRGISAMVSALSEMQMLKSFRKVELQRAVLAATYAASIESEMPPAEVFRMLGGDSPEDGALNWMQQYLDAIDEYSSGGKNLAIDGVRIPILMPGTKLNLKNPGAESPSGDKFEMSALRYVAAILGVSYEQLSRDYTNTNYSSSRASRGETEKFFAAKKKKVADGTANFIYANWLEEAINNNELECLKRKNVPAYYEGLNREAYTACDWIGAGAGLIDPLKETQASVLQLKEKINTRERVIAQFHGSDWRRILRQIAREEKTFKAAGVELPVDNTQDMKNALSGTPKDKSASSRAEIESIIEDYLEARAA